MTVISLKVPVSMAEELDRLVKEGVYMNRSEAIREAIRLLLRIHRSRRPEEVS
ncbi:MAG: CopG family transcriptional regulator [Thermoproteota archaeon]|nr:MAG: CopG family transcriptional regulator [Candidatus Korarchaeota archaeon]HDI86598.1 ribbon-helix-helix protein, CopG family [Candidatus Korarchaeota archaeon]